MKVFYLTFCILTIVFPFYGEAHSVSGCILGIDSAKKEALAGANIEVLEDSSKTVVAGTLSDENGFFSINLSKAAPHTIII